MLSLFGAFAEFERTIIVERGTDGIKAARDRGVVFGRPRTEKPEGFDKAVRRWKAGQATAVETFTALGLSKTMFYKMVKESKKAVK
jgi:DNA invertase Pin-like site-specific DNA recombinase